LEQPKAAQAVEQPEAAIDVHAVPAAW